jgi:NAD(P)-dependent dehydrogenase (short-subunit alcohol dehydrogenase family)
MVLSLTGRVVLVTGGASGIGRSTALLAAQAGAAVAVLDRDEASARRVAEEVQSDGGVAMAIGCDVSDEASVDQAVDAVATSLGVPDGLVAAAGVDLGGFVHELPADRWQTVLSVNLTGAFLVSRAVLRRLLAGGRPGSIVLCSSPAASVGFAAGGASAYAASKGGISALTRSMAVDYAPHGVRVNAIVPGPTETPLMWAAVPEGERGAMRTVVEKEVPIGRMAQPAEPARAAVWLLSDEASYVIGSHLVCDGGVLAKASISV